MNPTAHTTTQPDTLHRRAAETVGARGAWLRVVLMLFMLAPQVLAQEQGGARVPAPQPESGPADGPVRVTIPGTVVTIELRPVSSGSNPALTGAGSSLWMATTETTWDAFDVFVFGLDQPTPGEGEAPAADAHARPTRPYIAVDRGFGHAGFPALSVSVAGAQAYCRWLADRTGIAFRLPTRAEWQAACAADGGQAHERKETLEAVAWYRGNARYKTHAVASRQPDSRGLFDLQGNVSEWAVDADGSAWLMGGSYLDGLSDCGCDRARPDDPTWNASDPNLPKSIWWLADGSFIGFRVVCDGDPRPDAAPAQREGDSAGSGADHTLR